jgi:hypothetical protein
VCNIYEVVNRTLSFGIFKTVSKGDTEELRVFYAKKCCDNSFKMQYFIVAAIWGYIVLEPTGWLPWQLGGLQTI